ncbi:unnamed protein product, partial [Choristocarpus tenellus]
KVDVVEVEYSLLRRTVSTSRDFEGVRRAHDNFLSTMRTKFYIDNLNIKESIQRLLRLVLAFCCLLNMQSDAANVPLVEVKALQVSFEEEIVFLFPV